MMQSRPGKEQIGLIIDHADAAAPLKGFAQMQFCLSKDFTRSLVFLQSRTNKYRSKKPFSPNDVSFVALHIRQFVGTLRCHERSVDFSSQKQAERLIGPGRSVLRYCT